METETPTFPAPEGWELISDPGEDDWWWVPALDLHVVVSYGPGAFDRTGRRSVWWWVSTLDADWRPGMVRGHEWDECFADADDVIAYVHECAARFND